MKRYVLFDSSFGNTKMIAEAIARELNAEVASVSEFNKSNLAEAELLVVGSPIIGWKPSEKMGQFLASLESGTLQGARAATFDTRVKLFIHGDAMNQIARELKRAGAEIVVESTPFYVKGKEGPLFEGELEKAANWAKKIGESIQAKS